MCGLWVYVSVRLRKAHSKGVGFHEKDILTPSTQPGAMSEDVQNAVPLLNIMLV